jgi:acetyl-CoA carboxylase biotin carboxyl carrier protein
MIDLDFIERLIRTLDASGLDHVEIERGGTRVRISRTPAPAPMAFAPEAAAAGYPDVAAGAPRPVTAQGAAGGGAPASPQARSLPDNVVEITSPMVGTFYRAASPDAEPFTEVGRRIAKGDPLCIIEAMKLMNELEADLDGVVREVCVSNGAPVEYGQVLFRVEPA